MKNVEAMSQQSILQKLRQLKGRYEAEGFIILGLFGSYAREEQNECSDIDILYEVRKSFVEKYGFSAVSKIEEIRKELALALGKTVDLASRSGLSKTAQIYIAERTVYVENSEYRQNQSCL